MAQQLAFDLPPQVSLGAEDYFVSDANAQAFAMVCAPESWPDAKLVIVGPKGSGKSHLAGVFRKRADALLVDASEVANAPLPDTPVIVENMESLPADAFEQMFHLHNHLKARRLPLLMTAEAPPARWSISLPDLASRMQATTTVQIDDPDDRLLSSVLLKLFADRQLYPKPAVIAYLSKRLERSFAAAAEAVDTLDRKTLGTGDNITVATARRLLDNLDGTD